jgi:hypothetical protein
MTRFLEQSRPDVLKLSARWPTRVTCYFVRRQGLEPRTR